MLKLIGFVFRLGILSLIVLLLGNLVHWRGRTISDQVKVGMAQAEREITHLDNKIGAADSVRHWSRKLTGDAREGLRNFQRSSKTASGASEEGADIPQSERQKLRALIRELNGSR